MQGEDKQEGGDGVGQSCFSSAVKVTEDAAGSTAEGRKVHAKDVAARPVNPGAERLSVDTA